MGWTQLFCVASKFLWPFAWLQDQPPGHDVTVSRAKDKGHVCSTCYYVARGSFQGVKQHELRGAMDEHDTIKQKFPGWIKWDRICIWTIWTMTRTLTESTACHKEREPDTPKLSLDWTWLGQTGPILYQSLACYDSMINYYDSCRARDCI